MKIKFLLVLFISTISYAQITLNDMKSIIKMDFDSFETFAMNKGFSFGEICTGGEECVNYVKGRGEQTKYITLFTKIIEFYKKRVSYQTNSETEYLLIKKQMKEQGFSLLKTLPYEKKGILFKYYKNKNYQITVGIGKNELNTSTYEVNIEFIE
jgi:hypothetical protein